MDNILNKLLNKQSLHKSENKYYLSAYFPITAENRKSIDKYIKSLILQALRDKRKIGKMTRLHKNIIDKILGTLKHEEYQNLKNGLGIFIEFNAYKQEKGRREEILDNNIEIVHFPRAPKKEIFIGNVYRLDQLIWMENVFTESLVLNINETECEIYEIEGYQINKINTLKNTIRKEEKEFSRVYSPTGNIATTHGSGGSIIERNKEESIKAFLEEVLNYIGSSKSMISKFEYLTALYSNSYASFIEKSMKEHMSLNGSVIPILINKNLRDSNEILKIVRNRIKEFQNMTKKDSLDLARENYSYYCEGWLETTKAINKRKVAKLFIKPAISKTGYLDFKNKLVYTYAKKGTSKVNNIVPWAVKFVLNQGGELIVLRGDRHKNSPEIAAQLRYAKKRQNKNNIGNIKKWVEKRGGKPAIVKDTDDLLRIKFSDDEMDLVEISWEKFFEILDKNNLLFIYDKEKDSRFCTFVSKT